jgi:DNA-binding XRE family transcriptional regulator
MINDMHNLQRFKRAQISDMDIAESREAERNKDLRAILTQLGLRLEYARRIRGISCSTMAHYAGITRPTLHRIERGTGASRIETLLRVLHVMQLSIDFEDLLLHDDYGARCVLGYKSNRMFEDDKMTRNRGIILHTPILVDPAPSAADRPKVQLPITPKPSKIEW